MRAPRDPRVRIIVSYVALVALSAVLATFAIREVLMIRLEDQVDDSLQQEVLEFRELLIEGRDPETGQPFASLDALFDVFMERNVPGTDEALLSFIDGRLHRSELEAFPITRLPSEIMARWQAISRQPPAAASGPAVAGRFDTEVGTAYMRAVPVRIRNTTADRRSGAFVVTGLPVGEVREIRTLQRYVLLATLAVVLVASTGAWFVAGRALAPVRSLTQTARSISESSLTRRIAARGTDTVAEMANTFDAMLDRLESAFQSQGAFVRDASHELRDPLTVSRGHLELLDASPEQRETIGLVIDEIDRMARTVDDLQLLAEAEHPEFLRTEAIDLQHFARDLAAKASALGPRRWQTVAAAEGTLVADRHRLTEAVLNLAHNALQQTGPDDTITIRIARAEDGVRISVRDTGPGVPLADQARIFEPFQRGSSYPGYRGAGVGLAIVKKIAEAHGGRAELDSRPGEGATFTIVLPNVRRHKAGPDPDR